MDHELRSLVEAIRDGRIRDSDRVRAILREAKGKCESRMEQARNDEQLLYTAREAFADGWPTAANRA